MSKKVLVIVLVAAFVFLGTGIARAADALKPDKNTDKNTNQCGWTNEKFAGFLAGKYGIDLGEAGQNMTPEEKYNALSNALSQRGIGYFQAAPATDKLMCCSVGDVLYAVVGAKENLGTCDLKIEYLVKNGFLKLPASDADPCGVLCNIEETFNTPVVETFTERRTPPGDNPPGGDPERPSSRI